MAMRFSELYIGLALVETVFVQVPWEKVFHIDFGHLDGVYKESWGF
jgi:hypothetical protein